MKKIFAEATTLFFLAYVGMTTLLAFSNPIPYQPGWHFFWKWIWIARGLP